MDMKKLLFVFLMVMMGSFAANAQYNKAIGFRGGLYNGVTFKTGMGNSQLELIGSTRWRGINLTALYEKPYPLADVDGLYWFWGIGGHVGFWEGSYNPWWDDNESYMVIGADGIIGIEYVFEEIPICISLDYKPALNFFGYTGFWGDNGALSIRYTF